MLHGSDRLHRSEHEMHEARHAHPLTQQSPSVVTPPGQRSLRPLGPHALRSRAASTQIVVFIAPRHHTEAVGRT